MINNSSEGLADYTAPSLMVPCLQADTPAGVVAELCAVLERQDRLPDAQKFCDAVLAREQLSSTATPAGWALPHARLNGLPRLCFALARASRPIAWSGEARCPVHTIFLFAAPESAAKDYLNLISAVARLSQRSDLVEQLRRAPGALGMFGVLQAVPMRAVAQSPIPKPSPGRGLAHTLLKFLSA